MLVPLLLLAAPNPLLMAELERSAGTTIAGWQHRPTTSLFSRLENEGKPILDGESVAASGEPDLFVDDLFLRMSGRCPPAETCNEFRRDTLKKDADAARSIARGLPLIELEFTDAVQIGEYDFNRRAFPVSVSLRICKEGVCLMQPGADPKKPELFVGAFTIPVPERDEAEHIARWRDDPRDPKRLRAIFTLTGKVTGGRIEANLLALRVFGHRLVGDAGHRYYDPWVLLDHFPPRKR